MKMGASAAAPAVTQSADEVIRDSGLAKAVRP